MTYIRTGNVQMVQNTLDSYAPRKINVNFVRGIDEDFEGVEPHQSMADFSLVEVALAYKQFPIVKELVEIRGYPVFTRRYSQIDGCAPAQAD